jgi:ribonuclease P protein component
VRRAASALFRNRNPLRRDCARPPITVTGKHEFRPSHRLHTGADFDRVYRQGRRAGDNLFAINALANAVGHARLGMSVSYKSVGKAVRRNYIRRLIRDVFRHARPELPSLDYVVTSRPGARGATYAEIVQSLERLLHEATRRSTTPRTVA